MNDEFGIGSAAKLVQVHADALAVRIDAERNEVIEKGKEEIDEREDDADEGCNADELRHELSRLR